MRFPDFPVTVAGPGSQPAGPDGEDLAILNLPSGMDTYASPFLPEPEDVAGLDAARHCLAALQGALRAEVSGDLPVLPIDLADLDVANRELVDQVLGEGEVSIRVEGEPRIEVQESVLAGVWRVRRLAADGSVRGDAIEIGGVPGTIGALAGEIAAARVDDTLAARPDGVLNAPPLLTEINDRVARYRAGDPPHVINLTLLPQTEQDLAFLAQRLGQGRVTILSRGYGNCRITSTGIRHVWWVQYFNSQDRNILNTLEITDMPSVACAAPEDLADSAVRLDEILEIYGWDRGWDRGLDRGWRAQ